MECFIEIELLLLDRDVDKEALKALLRQLGHVTNFNLQQPPGNDPASPVRSCRRLLSGSWEWMNGWTGIYDVADIRRRACAWSGVLCLDMVCFVLHPTSLRACLLSSLFLSLSPAGKANNKDLFRSAGA